MSYEFSYDYKREVLVFKFPDDQVYITYYLSRRVKTRPQHREIWLRVRTADGNYRMRSYAFQFFQRSFRRIKCDKAKGEAKEIVRHLRTEQGTHRSIGSLLADYEQEQKEAIETYEEE